MRVLVKTVDVQTIPIHILPHETVRTLKQRVQAEINISPDQQKLVYSGRTLVDTCPLSDYNVTNDCIIHLLKDSRQGKTVQIFVKALTGNVVPVDVGPNDTVGDVKHKIYLKEKIPPSQQQLIFSGMSLANDSLVSTYNIQQHSTVHLVIKMDSNGGGGGGKVHSDTHARKTSHDATLNHSQSVTTSNDLNASDPSEPPQVGSSKSGSTPFRPQPLSRPTSGPLKAATSGPLKTEPFTIYCLTQSRRQVRVSVRANETVLDLKERLAVKEGIVLREQEIVLKMGDVELKEGEKLGSYGLSSESLVSISVVTKNVCTLFIKTLNGKTFILYPLETSIVSDIKLELAEKSGIPANQQRLVYQGADLPDHQTLQQCSVPTQCTLHVIQTNPPVPTRPKIPLLVKTFTGKAVTVYMAQDDTVRDIKDMISNKEGYPVDEIAIMLGGRELEDDKVIDHYQIQQGSTLLVTFKVKDVVKLAVFDASRSKMVYLEDVSLSDSISDVEKRLSGDLSIPMHIISIVHNGQVLNKQLTVEQCNFTDTSVVDLRVLQPMTLPLSIETLTGLKCQVDISNFQSVSAIKSRIDSIFGVPSEEQILIHKGNVLRNDSYLCDCISSCSNGGNIRIYMFTQGGINRNISLRVVPVDRVTRLGLPTNTTVAQIKKYVEDEHQVPTEQVSVSHNGSELSLPYTLGDYLILDGAELTATIHSREVISVTFQPDNGTDKFTLNVDGVESIGVVKLRVANQLKVSAEAVSLCYCGQPLGIENRVYEYKLTNPCVILVEIGLS